MKKDDLDPLVNMLEHISLIETYILGVTEDQFAEDMMRRDAVAKRLEAIGEEVIRLSDEVKAKAPEIPWHAIVGMRHRLVHNYGDTDLRIVWATLTDRLPELKSTVRKLLADLS